MLARTRGGAARTGSRRRPTARPLVVALGNLAAAVSYLGEPDLATALLEEALEARRCPSTPAGGGWRATSRQFALVRGDFEAGRSPSQTTRSRSPANWADEETLTLTITNKAFACVALDRPEAESLFAEALRRRASRGTSGL